MFHQLRSTLSTFTAHHPLATAFVYMLIGLLLIGLLLATGIIPGLHPSKDSATPVSTSTSSAPSTSRPKATYNEALSTTTPWQNASVDKAKQDMDAMTTLLNTPVGPNNELMSAFLPGNQNQEYEDAQNNFTDLVKQISEAPAATAEQISEQCDQLDAAYAAWVDQAWKLANMVLNDHVVAINTAADAGRKFLLAHPDYPDSCAQYAAYDLPSTKGVTKDDFMQMVLKVEDVEKLLGQCSTQMSAEQSSAMPQDQY